MPLYYDFLLRNSFFDYNTADPVYFALEGDNYSAVIPPPFPFLISSSNSSSNVFGLLTGIGISSIAFIIVSGNLLEGSFSSVFSSSRLSSRTELLCPEAASPLLDRWANYVFFWVGPELLLIWCEGKFFFIVPLFWEPFRSIWLLDLLKNCSSSFS